MQPQKHTQQPPTSTKAMALQQHGPPLGETLFGPGSAGVPQPFLAALMREFGLSSDDMLHVFQCNTVCRVMVIKEANMLILKADMDLPHVDLVPRLQKARSTLHQRGRQPMALWLKQTGAAAQATLDLVTVQLSDIPFTALHLGMASISTPQLLSTLQRMPNLTTLTLSMPLTDPMLDVLLDHAPHVKHVTLSSMQLSPAAQHVSTCSWVTLGITQQPSVPDSGHRVACQLACLPVTKDHKVIITLSGNEPQLIFQATQQGPPTSVITRLTKCFSFSHLAVVVITPATPASHASLPNLPALLELLSPLSTDGAAAELRGWQLDSELWAAVAGTSWTKVHFTSSRLSSNDWQFTSTALNITHLSIDKPLTSGTLRSLLRHAPALTHLGVAVKDNVNTDTTWAKQSLPVGKWPGLWRLGYLPKSAVGWGTWEVHRLISKTLKLKDITLQGVEVCEAATLSAWRFVGFESVLLRKQRAVQPADHVAALHNTFTQLQSQKGWVRQLRLEGGWVLTPGVAQELRSVLMAWEKLTAVELVWAPGGSVVLDSFLTDAGAAVAALGTMVFSKVKDSYTCSIYKTHTALADPKELVLRDVTVSSVSVARWAAGLTQRGHTLVLEDCTVRLDRWKPGEALATTDRRAAVEIRSRFCCREPGLVMRPMTLQTWVWTARSFDQWWPLRRTLHVPQHEFVYTLYNDTGLPDLSAEFLAACKFKGVPTVVVTAASLPTHEQPDKLRVALTQLERQSAWVKSLRLEDGWVVTPEVDQVLERMKALWPDTAVIEWHWPGDVCSV